MSVDLIQNTLTQYSQRLTDETILQAISAGNVEAAIERATALLKETPPPSQERLRQEVIGGMPLNDAECQATRLSRFLSDIDGAKRFSASVSAALTDVRSSSGY